MAVNNIENVGEQDPSVRQVADWYAGFTHRKSLGQSPEGVKKWEKSPLDEVKAAVVTNRKAEAVVVPEFPVSPDGGPEIAVSLRVVVHNRPDGLIGKDVSLALVTRNPNNRTSSGLEIQPIESVNDLKAARPEVLKGLADNLRGIPVARPVRLG